MEVSEKWKYAFEQFVNQALGLDWDYVREDPRVGRIVHYTSMQDKVICSKARFLVEGCYYQPHQIHEALGQSRPEMDEMLEFVSAVTDAASAAWEVFTDQEMVPSRFVLFYETATQSMRADFTYEDIYTEEIDVGTLANQWFERLQKTGNESVEPF